MKTPSHERSFYRKKVELEVVERLFRVSERIFLHNSGHSIFHNHNEDSTHDIRHQHQPLGQLQHHASYVLGYTGDIHSSRGCSRGSESRTGDQHQHWHQHRGQLQLHASCVQT